MTHNILLGYCRKLGNLLLYMDVYVQYVYIYTYVLAQIGCGTLCYAVEDHYCMVYNATDSEGGAAEVLGVSTS